MNYTVNQTGCLPKGRKGVAIRHFRSCPQHPSQLPSQLINNTDVISVFASHGGSGTSEEALFRKTLRSSRFREMNRWPRIIPGRRRERWRKGELSSSFLSRSLLSKRYGNTICSQDRRDGSVNLANNVCKSSHRSASTGRRERARMHPIQRKRADQLIQTDQLICSHQLRHLVQPGQRFRVAKRLLDSSSRLSLS